MTWLLVLAACGASEPPLEGWRGCVQTDRPVKVVHTGSLLFTESGSGVGDLLTAGGTWRGIELSRTTSNLQIELPPDLEVGDIVNLRGVDAIYNRARKSAIFASRHLRGEVRLLAVEGETERYALDAVAMDPVVRHDGQPDSVTLIGELVVLRTTRPSCGS